jgi:hypothetical protein
MKKLRNCPFCNKDVNDDLLGVHYSEGIKKWVFAHYCDGAKGVTIDVYGETEQEVIDKWNGLYEEDKKSEGL